MECIPEDVSEYCDFKEVYDEETTRRLEEEFPQLKGEIYLDHAGATLYSSNQLKNAMEELSVTLLGNPHSRSPSSLLMTDIIDQARYSVLQFFNTTESEYSVIFTSGATQSCKLVAEAFCFNTGNRDSGTFSYLEESHTSVVGMREIATSKHVRVQCVTNQVFTNIMNENMDVPDTYVTEGSHSLFVFPAQCNFSGVKQPLEYVQRIQRGALSQLIHRKNDYCNDKLSEDGYSNGCQWYCLLDATSLVATTPLDLTKYTPNFICLSFYKIFGYPTGIGALLVKKSSAHVLSNKSYFGGGTVSVAISGINYHVKRPLLHESMEDGTCNFLGISSLRHGFEAIHSIPGGMKTIATHTFGLSRRLHHILKCLHHQNGVPAVRLYCDGDFEDPHTQGPIVTFNLINSSGNVIGYSQVSHMATLHNIHLRTGCFCNTGACRRHLNLTDQLLQKNFQEGHVCGDEIDTIDGLPTGVVRVSFGYMSRHEDVDALVTMIISSFFSKDQFIWKFPNITASTSTSSDASCPEIQAVTSINVPFHTRLTNLFIYPIKSGGAFPVSTWPIDISGALCFDRKWVVVREGGSALTQKQEPRLCLLRPQVDPSNNVLRIHCEGFSSISVPLRIPEMEEVLITSLCSTKV